MGDAGIMQPEPIERQAWLALSVVTLVAFLVVIDVSVVNVAFPSIRKDLNASETTLSWIVSGYNIGVASLLLVSGRLADSMGRLRLFLPGVAIFMAGSLLCGVAPTAWTLVAARVVQAVGGAILLPSSLAVALPEFPLSRRSMAIGIWGAMGSLGAAFGPTVGSFLIEVGSWRYIFLINVPSCLAVLVFGRMWLRESRNPDADPGVDLLGVPIGTAGVGLVMLAIVQSEDRGLADGRVISLGVVGLALIAWLIVRSSRHPKPLLDLTLFQHRSFASCNFAVAFYSMGFTSGFLLNSLMLQTYWDLSVIQTGFALTPSPLLATVTSIVTGRYADRYGHRWLIGVGCLCCALSTFGFLVLLGEEPQVWDRFVPISLLNGIGVGMSIAAWFSASVSDVEPARFGVANATLRTVQQVFYGIGVSVVITLVASSVGLAGFQRAWVWVIAMYLLSAVLVVVTFPAGSSVRRAASEAANAVRTAPAPPPTVEPAPTTD
jgi:EmrB/QacA subfamily drug resistance transporter